MGISTEKLAERTAVKAATIRARFNRYGSYFGLTPEILPNRRLLWPDDSEAQLKAEAAKPEHREARLARAAKNRAGKVAA